MPTTIFTFLSDQYQHELKKQAELNTDRFETVMRNYKDIFWNEFNSLNNISNCVELNGKINHLSTNSKQNLYNWLDCFKQTVSTSTVQLSQFFDDLIDIYETYIKGQITIASQKFDSLLRNNNLYNCSADFERNYPVTFRGRIDSKYNGCNLFLKLKYWINKIFNPSNHNPDYFYHIPFDKVSLVKNYRFSITGQPFIYLGASIPTVLLELRSKLKDVEISTWGIKPNSQLKLFDISNALYDLINLNVIPIFHAGTGLTCHHTHVTPNVNTFVTDFKKFIISQFCTFKKRDFNGQVFVEQYVLPQLLTEQIRNYNQIKYDGFIFPSTQYLDRASAVDSEIYYGLFKNNIALFTDYSTSDQYDFNIINKFEIVPIDKSKNIEADKFITECESIIKPILQRTIIPIQIQLLKDYYKRMKLDGIILTNLKTIKIQFFAMIEYIKRL